MNSVMSMVRPALTTIVLCTLVFGVAYPLGVTAVAGVLTPEQAGGSLLRVDGRIVGAAAVGQYFEGVQWLHGRPSATPDRPYNAASSSGSNLGPAHPALRERVTAAIALERSFTPRLTGPVPVDLVTTSASGLDPHISPAAARLQVARIAAARAVSPATVQAIIDDATEGRFFGLFGEPRVGVLQVNLALEALPR